MSEQRALSLSESMAALRAKFGNFRAEMDSMRSAMEEATAERERVVAEVRDLTREVGNLRSVRNETESEVRELELELKRAELATITALTDTTGGDGSSTVVVVNSSSSNYCSNGGDGDGCVGNGTVSCAVVNAAEATLTTRQQQDGELSASQSQSITASTQQQQQLTTQRQQVIQQDKKENISQPTVQSQGSGTVMPRELVDSCVSQLAAQGFFIVDNTLPTELVKRLHAYVSSLDNHGVLKQGLMAGGRTGHGAKTLDPSRRGDRMAYVGVSSSSSSDGVYVRGGDGAGGKVVGGESAVNSGCSSGIADSSSSSSSSSSSKYDNSSSGSGGDGIPDVELVRRLAAGIEEGAVLQDFLSTTDVLVGHLCARVPDLRNSITQVERSSAMAAVYPGGGARYVRHVDNPGGAKSNGRVLTILLYLNPEWRPGHGGQLRLFPSAATAAAAAAVAEREMKLRQEDSEKAGVEVEKGQTEEMKEGGGVLIDPIYNRLVGFYADARTPHEVTPAHAARAALSVWYSDSLERAKALVSGMAVS
eukprot:UC1_evm1s1361